MPAPTKARFNEVQAAARQVVDEQGGVTELDKLPRVLYKPVAVVMYKTLIHRTNVTYDTARRHIAKAMRRARGEIVEDRRGGFRDRAGRPKGS